MFNTAYSMVNNWNIDQILRVARFILHTLESSYLVKNFEDINVQFFENVIAELIEFKPCASRSIAERYQECLRRISQFIGTSLDHISHEKLESSNLPAIGNFLEIIEFLVCYVSEKQLRKHSETKSIISGSISNIHKVSEPTISGDNWTPADSPKISNHVLQEVDKLLAEDSSISVNENQCADQDFRKPQGRSELSNSVVDLVDPNQTRLLYLRGKLLECLSKHPINSGAVSKDESSEIDHSDIQSACSDSCSECTRCTAEHRVTGSLIKPDNRPLVRLVRTSSCSPERLTPVPATDQSNNTLLENLLDSFPRLRLDQCDRNVLMRKAHNIIRFARNTQRGRDLRTQVTDRKMAKLRDRQRQRLAYLLRHDLQVGRLRERRASVAVDRHLRTQIRERRHQLVRARNYYQQFVQEFRRRKTAKCFEEERVFRQFFEQLLDEEKNYLKEIYQLERDEIQRKKQLIEEREAIQEHRRRTRIAMITEAMENEQNGRITQIQQEELELRNQKRELHRALEISIRDIQQHWLASADGLYFRQKDGERMLKSLAQK